MRRGLLTPVAGPPYNAPPLGMESGMLFGGCGCVPGSSLLSDYSSLCAGGAGFVSAMISSMVANARTADAPKLSRDVPEVDRLAVRMVTDNIVIQFVPPETAMASPSSGAADGNTTHDAPPRTALNGEWGLSMHAQSHRGGEDRNVLVDFGYTPEVLLNNLAILDLDAATFDALVLSHGHYDHFGGMVGFLKSNKGNLRKDTPFFIGGEDAFCIRRNAGGQFGALDRGAILDADLVLMMFGSPGRCRRSCLHDRPHRPKIVRKAAPAVERDCRRFRWLRLFSGKNASGEEHRHLYP